MREEMDKGNQVSRDKLDKVGFYHTPKQFLSRALRLNHPMDATDHLEQVTREALDFNLKYPQHVVVLERKKNLLHAKLLAAQTAAEEARLQKGLPEFLQKVLLGKRILVWKQLLERYGYDDMAVVNFMTRGVPLVGRHDTPGCYPELVRPATLTCEDLDRSACWRRKALLGKQNGVSNPDHTKHLEETAEEEIQMGFVEGPFSSEQEVTKFLGHDRWSVIRRFVLVQGGPEAKLRPIDDCHESQLNQAFTSTSYLQLQDMDYVSGLALRIAEAVKNGEQKFGSGEWLGKCLDISKAYKQMGVAPEHRHLAVIFFFNRAGSPQFLVANSLMFGATAEIGCGCIVTGNKPGRVERLLEHLANIKQSNKISLHESQIVHGLLRYACGFFAGRSLHQVCSEIMAYGAGSGVNRLRDL